LRHRTHESQHQGQSMFGDADAVAAGRVHDQHATMCGSLDVDIVDAAASPADYLEALGFVEEVASHLGGAAHNEGVGIGDFAGQRRRAGRYDEVPMLFAKEFDATRTDFVRNDDFHARSVRVENRYCQ